MEDAARRARPRLAGCPRGHRAPAQPRRLAAPRHGVRPVGDGAGRAGLAGGVCGGVGGVAGRPGGCDRRTADVPRARPAARRPAAGARGGVPPWRQRSAYRWHASSHGASSRRGPGLEPARRAAGVLVGRVGRSGRLAAAGAAAAGSGRDRRTAPAAFRPGGPELGVGGSARLRPPRPRRALAGAGGSGRPGRARRRRPRRGSDGDAPAPPDPGSGGAGRCVRRRATRGAVGARARGAGPRRAGPDQPPDRRDDWSSPRSPRATTSAGSSASSSWTTGRRPPRGWRARSGRRSGNPVSASSCLGATWASGAQRSSPW